MFTFIGITPFSMEGRLPIAKTVSLLEQSSHPSLQLQTSRSVFRTHCLPLPAAPIDSTLHSVCFFFLTSRGFLMSHSWALLRCLVSGGSVINIYARLPQTRYLPPPSASFTASVSLKVECLLTLAIWSYGHEAEEYIFLNLPFPSIPKENSSIRCILSTPEQNLL